MSNTVKTDIRAGKIPKATNMVYTGNAARTTARTVVALAVTATTCATRADGIKLKGWLATKVTSYARAKGKVDSFAKLKEQFEKECPILMVVDGDLPKEITDKQKLEFEFGLKKGDEVKISEFVINKIDESDKGLVKENQIKKHKNGILREQEIYEHLGGKEHTVKTPLGRKNQTFRESIAVFMGLEARVFPGRCTHILGSVVVLKAPKGEERNHLYKIPFFIPLGGFMSACPASY